MYNQYQNPYMNYGRMEQQPFQPMYQPMQQPQPVQATAIPKQQNILQGKMVETIEMAKNVEVPMDGSAIYMPLLDGSAVVSKKLTGNGTSEITIFKPSVEQKEESNPITLKDLKQSIERIKPTDNSDILDKLEELGKQIGEMKGKSK